MENCLQHIGILSTRPVISTSSLYLRCRRVKVKVKVKASSEASQCQFSSLNSPLEPRSLVGKFLSGVLQNHRSLFHVAVSEELKLLADDRDAALSRMLLSSASDDSLLHRFVPFSQIFIPFFLFAMFFFLIFGQ